MICTCLISVFRLHDGFKHYSNTWRKRLKCLVVTWIPKQLFRDTVIKARVFDWIERSGGDYRTKPGPKQERLDVWLKSGDNANILACMGEPNCDQLFLFDLHQQGMLNWQIWCPLWTRLQLLSADWMGEHLDPLSLHRPRGCAHSSALETPDQLATTDSDDKNKRAL